MSGIINLNYENVVSSASNFNSVVKQDIKIGILEQYKIMNSTLSVSCGDYIEQLRLQLEAEAKIVACTADYLTTILQCVMDSAKSMKDLDETISKSYNVELTK